MQIEFVSPLWVWNTEKSQWHFVCLPEDARDQVRFALHGRPRRGFGSVRVQVRVGGSLWRTSLFPDTQRDTYLLPIKKPVRDAEGLHADQAVEVHLELLEV